MTGPPVDPAAGAGETGGRRVPAGPPAAAPAPAASAPPGLSNGSGTAPRSSNTPTADPCPVVAGRTGGLHQRGRSEQLDGEREVPGASTARPPPDRPPGSPGPGAVREFDATARSPHDRLDDGGREHRTGREEGACGGGRLAQACRGGVRLDRRPGVPTWLERTVGRVRTAQPFASQQARHRDRRRRPVVHPRRRSGLPLAAPDDQFVDGDRVPGSLMVSCRAAARFHSGPLRSVERGAAEFLGVGSPSYPRSSPPC